MSISTTSYSRCRTASTASRPLLTRAPVAALDEHGATATCWLTGLSSASSTAQRAPRFRDRVAVTTSGVRSPPRPASTWRALPTDSARENRFRQVPGMPSSRHRSPSPRCPADVSISSWCPQRFFSSHGRRELKTIHSASARRESARSYGVRFAAQPAGASPSRVEPRPLDALGGEHLRRMRRFV